MDDNEADYGYALFGLIPIPVVVGEWLEEAFAVPWPARLVWVLVGMVAATVVFVGWAVSLFI